MTRAEDLIRTYDDLTAVDRVSFEIGLVKRKVIQYRAHCRGLRDNRFWPLFPHRARTAQGLGRGRRALRIDLERFPCRDCQAPLVLPDGTDQL